MPRASNTRKRGVGHDEVAAKGGPRRQELFEAHGVEEYRDAHGAGVKEPKASDPLHVLRADGMKKEREKKN